MAAASAPSSVPRIITDQNASTKNLTSAVAAVPVIVNNNGTTVKSAHIADASLGGDGP